MDSPATLFTVGRDLEEDVEGRRYPRRSGQGRARDRQPFVSHPYDLVRLGRDKIAAEIDRAHAVIAEASGLASGWVPRARLRDLR